MSTELAATAERVDKEIADRRQELVRAVRLAYSRGQTQAEISEQIGRSQPEVSRLLHLHGTSTLARRLRRNAPAIKRAIRQAGGSNVRVFGSLATGKDTLTSDIDLLFTMGRPLGLMELSRLEREVEEIVQAPVDLVPESSLRRDFRDRVLAEAVPL
ncbi:nucleotidyltransferase domain-containing protein [Brevibacterium luteolum]|uniref:nucleotidyltransferase family protein n=1 Tax=Brevibacterium luteolum TaxID=199591 RepID=UPI003EEC5E4C